MSVKDNGPQRVEVEFTTSDRGTRVRAECSRRDAEFSSDPRSGSGGGGGGDGGGDDGGGSGSRRFRQGLSTPQVFTATKPGRNERRAGWSVDTAGRGAVPTTPYRRTPMTVAPQLTRSDSRRRPVAGPTTLVGADVRRAGGGPRHPAG